MKLCSSVSIRLLPPRLQIIFFHMDSVDIFEKDEILFKNTIV